MSSFELDKLVLPIENLKYALLELGYELEHIKINKPIYADQKTILTICGVEIKDTIYEDEAMTWIDIDSRTIADRLEKLKELNNEL